MKWSDCTIYVVKTKALISCVVAVQLICTFVFVYAKIRFSHDVAHILVKIFRSCKQLTKAKYYLHILYSVNTSNKNANKINLGKIRKIYLKNNICFNP